jgi:phage terminase large subunit GpA-like protein
MMMLPTVELAKRHSKTKITPSIRAMDCMSGLIHDVKEKGGGNTILIKEFPGGSWSFVGSNSAAALRSVSIKYLILDDIDGYEVSVNQEGDPAELARKRMDAFSSSCKELRMSTPTIKEFSKIEKYFQEGDQSFYHVPCPHCGETQTLEFGGPDATFGLKWDRAKSGRHLPQTARYLCLHCGTLIKEHRKTWMLENGLWIAKFPDLSDYHRSFALNSLYSPYGWVSWEKIVREFLEAKRDPTKAKYQVWMNTRMGLVYEAGGEQPDWEKIKNRSEPYRPMSIPSGGLLVTAGVDVQADRFAIVVTAWGRGEECWVIYWGELYTDTAQQAAYDELSEFLSRKFPHLSGIELGLSAYAVDSGYRTDDVYNFCRTRSPIAMATKGSSLQGHPSLGRPTKQDVNYLGSTIKNGIQLWPIGSSTLKATIYGRLKIESPGRQYIHFYDGLPDDFYNQLTSEKQMTVYDKNGVAKRVWVLPSGKRNEALDCICGARAAAIRSGLERMDWDKLSAVINHRAAVANPNTDPTQPPKPTTPPPPRKRRRRTSHSSYLSSGHSSI